MVWVSNDGVTQINSTGAALTIFSSPEPKAHGELIVYRSIRRPSVRPLVRPCVRKHFQTQISPQPVGQS